MGMDVIRLKPHGLVAAPEQPTVVLAATAGTEEDSDLVSTGERARRIARVHGMNNLAGRPNAYPHQ
jgi:hypothetical protein